MPVRNRRVSASARRNGGQRAMVVLVVVTMILVLLLTLFNVRIRPIITQMATSRVINLATRSINNAINNEISNGNIAYDKLISLEKDSEGKVTALKTNMVEVNRLKTEITNKVIDEIESSDTSEIGIPVGTIISSNIFSGRGPKIPIKIVSVSSASSALENVFTSAGINQTRHQIVLNVTVEINILLTGYTAVTVVQSGISVAETVLIGSVPESYTYFEGVESTGDAAEKYFIYK